MSWRNPLDVVREALRQNRNRPQANLILLSLAIAGIVCAVLPPIVLAAVFIQDTSSIRQAAIVFVCAMGAVVFVFFVCEFLFTDNFILRFLRLSITVLLGVCGISLVLFVASAFLFQRPCGLTLLLLPKDQVTCNQLNPTSVTGIVRADSPPHSPVSKARVLVKVRDEQFTDTTEPDGRFDISIKDKFVGEHIGLTAEAPGFSHKLEPLMFQLKSGLNEREIYLHPENEQRKSLLRVPNSGKHQRLASQERTPASYTYANFTVVDRQMVAQAASSTPDPLFDGKGWTYDVFYCREDDGDSSLAKSYADAVAQRVRDQDNIGRVRVRLWPRSGTRDQNYGLLYDIRNPFDIRITKGKERVAEQLKALVDPIVKDSGTEFKLQEVGSNFPDYISMVICPNPKSVTKSR